ncbi:S9 family peptidase [Vitellibacter sp. q18]|nr:S9 family peptidase [Aequorivita lutea]
MKLKRINLSTTLKFVLIVIIYLTILSNAFVVAQTPEKLKYSAELDSLWSMDTNIYKISNDGKWVIFSEKYPNDKMTVWLMATNGNKLFQFPNSEYLNFSSNSKWFACITNENELISINLQNGKEKRFNNISDYGFSNNGTHIAMSHPISATEKELLIINLETQKTEQIANVVTFKWNPKQNLLYAVLNKENNTQLIRYETKTGESKNIFNQPFGVLEHLDISSSGNSLLFVSHQKGITQLNYYDIVQDSLSKISDTIIQKIFPCQHISNRKPNLAADGKKVIFYTQFNQSEIKKAHDAHIWYSDDPWIEPRMKSYREQEINYPLTAWFPESGQINAIETKDFPSAAMDVNHDFALVYDQLQYEPLYKFYPNADLYIKNTKTGDTNLVCKNQYTEGQFVTISPTGKYISYFKGADWCVYNIANDESVNITKDLPFSFANTEYIRPRDVFPYGNPGWLPDDEYITLYDQFDIWLLSPDGNIKKRITKGREENIRYRISRDYTPNIYNPLTVHPDFSCAIFNPKDGVVLELFNNKNYSTGLAVWKDNAAIKPLLWVEGKIDQIRMDAKGENLVFREQRFDKPISIHHIDVRKKKENQLFQTNDELLKYDLGKIEIVEYELEDGTQLQGSLVYPSNYNPSEKYPLIVEIYEKKSFDINKFDTPSNLMTEGFNILKYATNGYFIFYPNIAYNIGDPGISALQSVTAAVNKVLENKGVDKERIGLIGHSFGGYETAFIITQTNMFAAAVAGAAITDFSSFYHDISWDYKFTQMWRLENQQFRMKETFYDAKEAYYRNSPLQQVENINTPLLLWAGKKDTNVNWSQSVYMFMALKRLGKKAKLILYEDEDHSLFKPKNQTHLSNTIFDWMETYVKKIEKN